jgi:hypothetical protein
MINADSGGQADLPEANTTARGAQGWSAAFEEKTAGAFAEIFAPTILLQTPVLNEWSDH